MLANLLKAFTSESFIWGGFTFILGVCVVFLGMIILVLAVSGMGIAMKKFDEIKKELEEINECEFTTEQEVLDYISRQEQLDWEDMFETLAKTEEKAYLAIHCGIGFDFIAVCGCDGGGPWVVGY